MSESMLSTETGTSTDTAISTETTDAANAPKFSWSEGIAGEGDAPEWYKGDKYKSVAEQAKAYTDLEKRFGGFTGAPEAYALPEGLDGEDHFVKTLSDMGLKNQMSQESFSELLELGNSIFESKEEFDQEREMAALGDNAQERLDNITGFMKNNLGDKYEGLIGHVNSAKAVELVEALIGGTKGASLPGGSSVVTSKPSQGELEGLMTEKGPDGKVLYHHSKARQDEVQQMMERMHS
jgi:hypothetical protein